MESPRKYVLAVYPEARLRHEASNYRLDGRLYIVFSSAANGLIGLGTSARSAWEDAWAYTQRKVQERLEQ